MLRPCWRNHHAYSYNVQVLSGLQWTIHRETLLFVRIRMLERFWCNISLYTYDYEVLRYGSWMIRVGSAHPNRPSTEPWQTLATKRNVCTCRKCLLKHCPERAPDTCWPPLAQIPQPRKEKGNVHQSAERWSCKAKVFTALKHRCENPLSQSLIVLIFWEIKLYREC